MQTPDVISGNRVIAEFHGWKHIATPKNKGKGFWNFPEWGKAQWDESGFAYHSSWDWFMDAYKKLFDWLQEQYKKSDHNKHSITEIDLIESEIHCAVRVFDLPKAHSHLVHAIQVYNTQ